MKNTVNMDVLKACAVLSNYNWFKVTNETGNKKNEFYATGIEAQFDGETIKLEKQFATPKYMGGFTKIAAEAENCIVFDAERMDYSSGNGKRIAIKYSIEGLHKELTNPDKYSAKFDSMESLTDYKRSHKDKNRNMIIVLDFRKLGWITAVQEAQIKRYINVTCRGQASKYQTPRTVYFKICSDGNIYVGAWDYATEQPMTERPYFETWMILAEDPILEEKAVTLRKLAQSVTEAI